MPQPQVRVTGSGYTTFNYAGKPIAWLENFRDSGQTPMGQAYEAITPIGKLRPEEIVTQRVLSEGRLTMSIREVWNVPVWQSLPGLANTHDIGQVFDALRRAASSVTAQLLIKPPGQENNPSRWRGKIYHNVVISEIDDSETITTGGLSVLRDITAVYTHTTPYKR
jgi:hypothetical protein